MRSGRRLGPRRRSPIPRGCWPELRTAMATRTVAYLTPLYFDERSCLGGGERYPLNLARGVVAGSHGSYAVDLISFGDAPHRQQLAPGVTLRVLPASRR